MSDWIDVVFLDVGGPVYDDGVYAAALFEGLNDLGAEVGETEFRAEYDRCRRAQAGFTRPLAERFAVDACVLRDAAAGRWRYPPEALYPDVLPTLERLAGRYRIGVLANQPRATRTALERDGVARYVDLWVVSEEIGLAKPSARIFARALEVAACEPGEAVLVGNRLDNDIRPARAAGLRTVWLLRGEAPDEPTAGELTEADATIRSLAELPEALERLAPTVVRP